MNDYSSRAEGPTTRIPELLVRPMTGDEFQAVCAALTKVAEVQEAMPGATTTIVRLELAAAFLADVLRMIDDKENEDLGPDAGLGEKLSVEMRALHTKFIDICNRRAREIYRQGHG